MGQRMGYDSILTACLAADVSWPQGRDRRFMAAWIADRAGINVDSYSMGCGKGCVASGAFVIKTGNAIQISQALECEKRMGNSFAHIFAHGVNWMIQERVSPLPDSREMHQAASALGVMDTRRNSGANASGRIVAFDGFPTVDPRA